MDRLVKERGEGYGKRKNGDKNAFNLKTIVGSACDTDVAAAPNLLLPLSHFYPPLKCRALSVPSVLAKPGNRLPRKCYKYYRRQTYSSDAWSVIMLQHLQFPPCISTQFVNSSGCSGSSCEQILQVIQTQSSQCGSKPKAEARECRECHTSIQQCVGKLISQ